MQLCICVFVHISQNIREQILVDKHYYRENERVHGSGSVKGTVYVNEIMFLNVNANVTIDPGRAAFWIDFGQILHLTYSAGGVWTNSVVLTCVLCGIVERTPTNISNAQVTNKRRQHDFSWEAHGGQLAASKMPSYGNSKYLCTQSQKCWHRTAEFEIQKKSCRKMFARQQ